jgi:hypothetical protein
MRVAIFTDNDVDKTNGVTTTLRAVLRHVPSDLDLRKTEGRRQKTEGRKQKRRLPAGQRFCVCC